MSKDVENMINAMRLWALQNHLEKEFTEEMLNSKHLDAWVRNDALMKRFGYFVLEHSVKEILYARENEDLER